MKLFILFASIFALNAFAAPPPQQQQQDDQQQQQGQDQQDGQCHHCSPPPIYLCHAQMVDCYGRPLYTYWAKGPRYDGACQFAIELCLRDASMGYGGYGARCYILGK